MQKPNVITSRYEVTTCFEGNITTQTMSRDEVRSINPQSVDHFMSFAFGVWGYRTAEGKWIEHRTPWNGIGDTCVRIIQAVQICVGEHLTPADVAELTGIGSLRNGNTLSARWRMIRLAHGETYAASRFFLSRRSGGHSIAWNPEYSWIWIERIGTIGTKSAADKDKPESTA